MQVNVSHALSVAEAKARLEKFADNLKQQFPDDAGSITQCWEGNRCSVNGKVRGFPIACTLEVTDAMVIAKGDLPFFMRPFPSAVETVIRNGIEKALR